LDRQDAERTKKKEEKRREADVTRQLRRGKSIVPLAI